MKNKQFFAAVVLSFLSLSLLVVATPRAQAQYQTPVTAPIPSPSATPVPGVTASVIGTPTLTLAYDPNHKESSLTSSFNVSVYGGATGVHILKAGAGWALNDYKGGAVQGNSITSRVDAPSNTSTVTDNYGQVFWAVPAGQTVTFTVTGTINPQTLFAGTYTATLSVLIANPGTTINNEYNLVVAPNQSNAVTVVGEVSPYITSVTNPVSVGQTMVINGQRLSQVQKGNSSLYIDNVPQSILLTGSFDGTTLSFTVPSLSSGSHSLYVTDPTTGKSNTVSFQVQDSSPCYTFGTNLGVGSTGPDVVALQTLLIGLGYNIPGISSGATAKGYYGPATAAAVVQFQQAYGIQATGYAGPLTRAALNNASCKGGGGITTPGTSGTLSASQSGSVYTGTTLTLQANGSDMDVNSISVGFNARAWQDFSSLSLVNQATGQVLVQSGPLSQTMFIEESVGADYRYVFSGFNLIVPMGQSVRVVINGQPISGASHPAITYTLVRSVDGAGVTHISSTGSTVSSELITASLDPSSPVSSLIQISSSVQTQNVLLGVFDLKSANTPSSLQSLVFNIATNGKGGVSIGQLFNNISIKVLGQTFSASAINLSGAVTFSNLIGVTLPADAFVPVSLFVTVAPDTTGALSSASAQATLNANPKNVVVLDPNYNNIDVQQSTITANTQSFISGGVLISSFGGSTGVRTCDQQIITCYQTYTVNYGVTASNNSVYIPSSPSSAFTWGPIPGGFTVTPKNLSDDNTNGDGAGYFYIAPGQTKYFTDSFNVSGPASGQNLQICSLNYGSSSAGPFTSQVPNSGARIIVFDGGANQTPNCTPVTPALTTVTLVSPNGGETLNVGLPYTFKWNVANLNEPMKVNISLFNSQGNRIYNLLNGCYNCTVSADLAAQNGASSYTMVIPSALNNLSSTVNLAPYKIEIMLVRPEGMPYPEDMSDNSVNVQFGNPTTVAKPPVISGLTAPTQLTVGQTGTWYVSASDPQNGSLSYAVNWGDNAPTPMVVTQTTSYQHAYSSAGTYTVTFTVTNSAGLSAKTSASVYVTSYVTPTPTPTYSPTPTSVPVTVASPDLTPPSTPTGLVASSVSTSQINVTWNASTDNLGVAGYRVYRNGILVGTVTGTAYQATGLTAGTSYYFNVSAFDGGGNTSQQSNSVTAATQFVPAASPTPTGSPSTTASPSPTGSPHAQATDNNSLSADIWAAIGQWYSSLGSH